MLPEECGRILSALAETFFLEGEVRPGLLHDLSIKAGVEHRALPGDPRAVDDVELGLLERRRTLVLHDFYAHAVADRLDAFLQRFDAADVQPDGRIELERTPAGCRLGVTEHDADLLAKLIREDADRVGAVERAGELAQRLRHQARLQSHVGITHLALDLRLRGQGGDRVDGDHVECARADQQLRDLERLLAGIRLRYEEIVDVDADSLRVRRIHSLLAIHDQPPSRNDWTTSYCAPVDRSRER